MCFLGWFPVFVAGFFSPRSLATPTSGLTKTGSKHADFLTQRRKLFWNAKKKHARAIVNFTPFWETQHLSKNNVKPSQTSDSFYTRSLSKGCSFLPFLFLPSDFFPFPLSPLLSPFDVRQTWEFEVKWLQCYRPREGGKKNWGKICLQPIFFSPWGEEKGGGMCTQRSIAFGVCTDGEMEKCFDCLPWPLWEERGIHFDLFVL